MEFMDNRISCREAREIDLVTYLSGLGHEPVKTRGDNWWYLSPLRDEATASFKVNRRINRWYDFGMGKGGNLVDFAIEYHDCTVGEFLQSLQDVFSFQRPALRQYIPSIKNNAADRIEIVKDRPLFHPALLDYLQERGIPVHFADRHCREIHYRCNGKQYFAIGFANDLGGYELRNAYFKGSTSPKVVTTVLNGNRELMVFEGFIDFLSFLVLMGWEQSYLVDFIILNSLSFFENSMPLMAGYSTVRLYLDNDAAGQHCSRNALASGSHFVDGSTLYKNYKDLNDFLLCIRKPGNDKITDAHGPP